LSTSTPELPLPEQDASLQRQLADAVSAFGDRVKNHGELTPFPADRDVSATDVAVTAAAILKAAEISSFEIAALFNI
jgi:hypothetical protein